MFRRVGHCASQLASGGDCWPGSGNVPCARGVGDSPVPWLAQVWRPAAGWGTASSGRVLWSVRPAHLLPRPQAVSVAGAPRRVLFVPLPRRRFSAVDAVVLAEVVVLSGAQKALSTSGAGAPGRLRRRSGVSLAPREVPWLVCRAVSCSCRCRGARCWRWRSWLAPGSSFAAALTAVRPAALSRVVGA